ncbi:MAG TPA: hypothetical protein DHN33_01205 [Eubacteriaceae bacterium]|nr:hypothetical protein [Eubacteriaceae bacterium]
MTLNSINISGEYIALLFLVITYAYARRLQSAPTFQNNIFLNTIKLSIVTALTAVLRNYWANNTGNLSGEWWTVSGLLYDAFLMLTAFFLFFYAFVTIYQERVIFSKSWYLLALPALAGTGSMVFFFLNEGRILDLLPLYVTVFYVIAILALLLLNYKKLKQETAGVLTVYPIFYLGLLTIQYLQPDVQTSGIASATAIVILSLYAQNKEKLFDSVSGLPNRYSMIRTIQHHVQCEDFMDIILISINNMDEINERYGYSLGNQFLYSFGRFLREEFGKKNVFRYAGSEFVLIYTDLDEYNIDDALARLKQKANASFQINEALVHAKINFALSKYPDNAKDDKDIIALLDYQIKETNQGYDQEVIEASEMTVEELHRYNRIIELLRERIRNEDLIVHYQPIYNLNYRRYVAAEALMRLHDKQLGDISPGEFIPIAEQNHLIEALGYQVLRKACRVANALEDHRLGFRTISVNASTVELLDPVFVDTVKQIAAEEEVNPNKICFEITESVMIDNPSKSIEVMQELIDFGFKFSLDDFGTGYSNFSNVIGLPLKEIKIDKTMLYYAQESESAFIVLDNLVKGLQQIGFAMVIEGAETIEQVNIAERLGIYTIQGYYFSVPLDERDLIETFEEQRI